MEIITRFIPRDEQTFDFLVERRNPVVAVLIHYSAPRDLQRGVGFLKLILVFHGGGTPVHLLGMENG